MSDKPARKITGNPYQLSDKLGLTPNKHWCFLPRRFFPLLMPGPEKDRVKITVVSDNATADDLAALVEAVEASGFDVNPWARECLLKHGWKHLNVMRARFARPPIVIPKRR